MSERVVLNEKEKVNPSGQLARTLHGGTTRRSRRDRRGQKFMTRAREERIHFDCVCVRVRVCA